MSTWLRQPHAVSFNNKLYSVADRVRIANDPRINQDWDYLASNNFRFMTTKPSNVESTAVSTARPSTRLQTI